MSTMNQSNEMKPSGNWWGWVLKIVGVAALLILGVFAVMTVLVATSTPLGGALGSFYSWLIAANTTQRFWYVTRAAGITGYLLLWLSTAWGLAVPSRILQGKLHGTYTYDFHQFISLLAIGFIALHVGVLMLDAYLPFSIAQILVPFIAPYRSLWVGVGILSFYVILLVTFTFYIRNLIGSKAFRTIHVFSLLAFIGAAVHGFFAGTDSPLPVVQWMYGLTFLSIVFLTTYWMVTMMAKKNQAAKAQNPQRSVPGRQGQVVSSQRNPRLTGQVPEQSSGQAGAPQSERRTSK